jgi:hypothetical protein
MNAAQDKPADTFDPADWMAFDDAYEAFASANPMLGLGTGQWATINLRRNFGPQLIATGAVVALVNRRWLAHRERFGPALFAVLSSARAGIIDAAKARQAAGKS